MATKLKQFEWEELAYEEIEAMEDKELECGCSDPGCPCDGDKKGTL